MKPKVAIIYYSATGTTYKLAQAMEQEAQAASAETRLRKAPELAHEAAIQSNKGWAAHRLETQHVPDATNDDLVWADAIIFGTPTRYGLPSAQWKQFIDRTGPLWASGALVNKVVSSFATTATAHGGQESTIIAMNNVAYHWGCIIVGPGYVEPSQYQSGNPYGASHTSANGQIPPDDVALVAAQVQARRVVAVVSQFLAGATAKG
jgi:NAD(P)H dehydrogenase (quinone)